MLTTTRSPLWGNIPYAGMMLLGAAVFPLGGGGAAWAWLAAAGYVAWGVGAAVWVMWWVCPWCRFHGTDLCPCGYGRIAARLRRSQGQDQFPRQFRRHIPVVYPIWFVPPIAAGVLLWRRFDGILAAVLGAFVVVGFVLVPLIARRTSCASCPQRATCPWMGRAARA